MASVPAEIAPQEVLNPMNVDHMRRARIIAEIMITTCREYPVSADAKGKYIVN